MFSKVITVYFAVNVISAASGFIDSKLRVLEPVLKCYEFSHENVMAALTDSLHSETDRENLKLWCRANEEYGTCLADLLEKTPSPVPKVFLLYSAEAYQTSYLLKKAKLCPGMKYDDLKRIVLDSGILKEEGFSNIEHDRYHKCAGDAMKECSIELMQVFEHEQGDPDEDDDTVDAYIRCMEEQSKICNHPIMRHLLEQIKTYKEHVRQLELLESEEQQG